MRVSLTRATTFFLVWGAYSIEYVLPLFIGLLLATYTIYVRFFGRLQIDNIGALVLANLMYWLLSAFLVDAIHFSDLFSPKLYNGEGRIFISAIPLLLFSLTEVTHEELRSFVRTLLWVGWASLILFLVWMVTKTPLASGAGHTNEFHGFLTSHTGAGTFFGSICVFVTLYGYERRNLVQTLLGLSLLGAVFATGSREALTGIIAVAAWYLIIQNPKPKLLVAGLAASLILLVSLPSISDYSYKRIASLLSVEFVESVIVQAEVGWQLDWQVGDWGTDAENLEEGGDVNSLVRIMLWTYAIKRFLDSPLFGMGWGRFNDHNVVLMPIPLLAVSPALDGDQKLSTSNAHNSYLHILAESGLLGALLFFSVWLLLFRRIRAALSLFKHFHEIRSYFVASIGLIIYALTCALTGHALASPSIMIPTLTILGVAIAYHRTNMQTMTRDSASIPGSPASPKRW